MPIRPIPRPRPAPTNPQPTITPTISVSVLRPRDFLLLDFKFINFRFRLEHPGTLEKIDPNQQAYIIVTFPPQSIMEQAFFEVDPAIQDEGSPPGLPPDTKVEDYFIPPEPNQSNPASPNPANTEEPTDTHNTPPVYARLSGSSRLVFKVPDNVIPIPYTIEGLLDTMLRCPLEVTPAAAVMPASGLTFGWLLPNGIAGLLKEFTTIPKPVLNNPNMSENVKAALAYANAVQRKTRITPLTDQLRFLKTQTGLEPSDEIMRDILGHAPAEVVAGVNLVHLTTDQILALRKQLLTLAVPTDLQTSLETPFRLILSPNRKGAWVHLLDEKASVHQTTLPGILHLSGQPITVATPVTLHPAPGTVVIDTGAPEILDIAHHYDIPATELIDTGTPEILDVLHQPGTPADFLPISENIDWVELWHTRLATRLDDGSVDPGANDQRAVRAIWAKDARFSTDSTQAPPVFMIDTPTEDDPVRDALDACDRFNIVHLSSNFSLQHKVGTREVPGIYTALAPIYAPFDPQPIAVDRLMLSTLGSWLNVRGSWTERPDGLEVEEWRHRSTLGRDHYVRVVYAGVLFPFGHRVSLIKVSERKFHGNLPGNPAYLRQRMFIVVREPDRYYGFTGISDAKDGKYDLAFPFTHVRITTLVTPSLDQPENSDIQGKGRQLFRPRDGATQKDVLFHIIAEDLDGRKVEFSTPLTFVGSTLMKARGMMQAVRDDFTSGANAASPAELAGQEMCFAPCHIQGDTTFNVEQLWFDACIPDEGNYNALQKIYTNDIGWFHPCLRQAAARIPALQHLAGSNTVATFKLASAYLKNGFDSFANKGEVFAELVNTVNLDFSGQGQRSGGLLTPNIKVNGLSRALGPVGGEKGDLADITSGTFDPEKFFDKQNPILNPMLFGVIHLWDIVDIGDLVDAPHFLTQVFGPAQSLMTDLNKYLDQVNDMGDLAEMVSSEVINALKDAFNAVITSITGILGSLPDPIPDPYWNDLINALNGLKTTAIPDFITALNNPAVSASARILLAAPLNELLSDLGDQDYIDGLKKFIQAITDQKVSLDWKPKLQDWSYNDITNGPIFDTCGKKAYLHLHAEVDARAMKKGDSSMMVSCGLKDFNLNLIGNKGSLCFIILHFKKLEFVYAGGSKTNVNVDMDKIEFKGVLAFVDALRSLIPLGGFKDPPGLDVSTKGISANYTLALPNLAFGVFSLTNLSLSASFSIPFIGDPLSVRFAFCSRENPFNLSVALFSGGGFFAIALQPRGLQMLEASFEFGASISIDFGVASGGVHVMAGIYFKMQLENSSDYNAALTGYFRMGGNVSVLGLISASIELYLSLSYEFASGKCVGKAKITIEVSVLFFSTSVTISCERKFAGSNSDPTFAQLMGPYVDPISDQMVYPWAQYCEAFA